jgi:hypothetical protein
MIQQQTEPFIAEEGFLKLLRSKSWYEKKQNWNPIAQSLLVNFHQKFLTLKLQWHQNLNPRW